MLLLDFIFASRPLLHLPLWSIFLVSFHYHALLTGKQFGWSQFGILVLLSMVAAGAYLLNQVYDYESDRLNNKLGFLQRKLITRQQMIFAFTVFSTVVLIASFFYSYLTVFFFGQLVVLGYFYSAPPLKLKDRPVWGLLANCWGYGLVVPCTVMPELNAHNNGLLGWDNPFYFFCTVGSIYLLTTIHDIEGDKREGKKTLAVILPSYQVKILAMLFLIGAVYFAWSSEYPLLMVLAIVSMLLLLLTFLIKSDAMLHIATKLPILLLTLVAGYFYPFYLMFIVALLLVTRIYYARRFNMIYPKLH